MLFSLLVCSLLFFGTTLGLAWPLVARFDLDPAEKLVTTAALSLFGTFLIAWMIYVDALPAASLWALPVLAAAGLAVGGRALVAMLRDPDARGFAIAQLLVTGWCVGWLAFVATYSGGGWAGDWFEHWERARFFLERWPLDQKFLGSYPLTARPPLANVVTGAFLRLSRVDFAHYQLVSTLFASLVFLPAALLARRFQNGRAATATLAVLFMVSPLFVQNATFAWTKLPAAFFVLGALYFFLAARRSTAPLAPLLLCAVLLAAALLTHYSAGPYAVLLALAWLVSGYRRRDAAWWRTTGLAAAAGALVLATWFGWSLYLYGARGTLLSNSSVTSGDMQQGSQLEKIALNLWDTFVPHFLRSFDTALVAQRSAWGEWRDFFFQSYQLNLPLAFGSVAWLAIWRESFRAAHEVTPRTRRFWTWFVAGVVLLGVATHGQRDHWGLTHICLQALVLLGLAFLAARWAGLGRAWRLALVAGATVDLTLGIALQFAVENNALDRWFAAGRAQADLLVSYNETALMNLAGKLQHGVSFFADVFPLPGVLIFAGLIALLATALRRAR